MKIREVREADMEITHVISGFEDICTVIDHVLDEAGESGQVNVAVDGVCGGGKTTLGKALAAVYDCNLFHMDDFFLRAGQRTPERYAQPGGNVDYERFRAEVLDHLADAFGFTYRRFDCQAMELGESYTVARKKLNIIEGAYSCHPYFGDVYQARFFIDLPVKEQKERILSRNGEKMYHRFVNEWIPMENSYFDTFKIREKCMVMRL